MTTDPYNYPSLNRQDLMSLSTINARKDNTNTSTKRFSTGRLVSTNLDTADITGKYVTDIFLSFRCITQTARFT